MAGAGGHRNLKVYRVAYRLAVDVFQLTKRFPQDERYSLTDQIRRSSRAVASNIAEAFRKRRYTSLFVMTLTHADAEATETQVCLDFARDCGYLLEVQHQRFTAGYEEVGRMVAGMIAEPWKFSAAHQIALRGKPRESPVTTGPPNRAGSGHEAGRRE